MPHKENMPKKELSVRECVAAGMFYPAEKEILEKQIKDFLARVKKTENNPKILIVPHAGYDYSGQVAAYAFKQLEGENFERVVLIGPSHYDYFDGLALSEDDFWQTPLGKAEVDHNFYQELLKENKNIFYRQISHQQEHSLEVELPFLQTVLKDFKIAPIMISGLNAEILAEALKNLIDEKTLVVISSDLSHYPPYEIANQTDKKTIEAILSGKAENFEKAIQESMSQNSENLDTCACGGEPIKTALLLARDLEIKDIKLLKYANSGDTSNDYSKVVGYASIIFSKNDEDFLSETEKQELLKIARQSIENYFKGNKMLEFEVAFKRLKQPQGAFVTLRKGQQLRGCIGIIEEREMPLYKVVSQMAIAAAFEDPRFIPVSAQEMDELKIEISVLSPLKKISDPFKEIEINKHGVIIKKGSNSGVFLPQVAAENNWDLETFMNELCQNKAGLPKTIWKTGKADIYIFSAEIFEEK